LTKEMIEYSNLQISKSSNSITSTSMSGLSSPYKHQHRSGYSLQVRHNANALFLTVLFTTIRQPVNRCFSIGQISKKHSIVPKL